MYELQVGAELTRLQDIEKATELDEWIDAVARDFYSLPYETEVARQTARLLRKQPPNLFADAAIAATAQVYGLTVATRNTQDFERFEVPLINPFTFGLE